MEADSVPHTTTIIKKIPIQHTMLHPDYHPQTNPHFTTLIIIQLILTSLSVRNPKCYLNLNRQQTARIEVNILNLIPILFYQMFPRQELIEAKVTQARHQILETP